MKDIKKAGELIKNSKHLIVLTGAGASTESGLLDFRSPEGMWKKKDPRLIANVDALYNNTEEFQEFYTYRIKSMKDVKPNRVHHILNAWLEKKVIKTLITQNVDGLHGRAGSNNIIELHGTLSSVKCSKCNIEYPNTLFEDRIFTCGSCKGLLRPSVVLFGESLPTKALNTAFEEATKGDLILVVGSSLEVSPANMLPIDVKRNGGKFIIINKEKTSMDYYADIVINGNAGDILEEVDKILNI
jgi:NAD-dependent deacetylase